MTTICVSEEIITLLDNLDEPVDFCDESGHLLGSFIPEPALGYQPSIVWVRGDHREAEDHLGPEMCVFGYEADLE